MTLLDCLNPSCALFLDFDGTVVEIALRPDAVVVPHQLPETLGRLQQRLGGAIAVVSGRPITQIDRFLAPLVLSVAGVHGAERRRADGSLTRQRVQPLERVKDAAMTLVYARPALRVEAKRGSIALHYRQAPHLQSLCLRTMQAVVEKTPGLTLLCGKMVVEAKPSSITKSLAIEAFMREPPFAGRTAVFIGDDITDEAGFACVQRHGGVGVKVGEGETVARLRIPDPAAMRDALALACSAETERIV